MRVDILFSCHLCFCFFFFFNDTAPTEIYTLSLHDALPIRPRPTSPMVWPGNPSEARLPRSEEHTSELQSQFHLVCRLLLEKKKKNKCDPQLYIKKNQKTKNTKLLKNQ